MRKEYRVICLVSLLSLMAGQVWSAVTVKSSCESLGYTTLYEDCIKAGGTPLFCPFHSVEKPMTLCISRSCRGFPLTAADLEGNASDGKPLMEHIDSLEECNVSPIDGEGQMTYYRVKKCKTSSLFQNDLCDVGCLEERYPYDSHQGNIAGDMRKCEDNIGTGEHYGYETCNDGWEGGWKYNHTGKCELSVCDIKNFPYTSNPNTLEYNRGITKQCLVGGNAYYRYSETDSSGSPTDDACGAANHPDLTLVNAICQKQCNFSNCTNTTVNQTLAGINFSYKEWKCKLDTEDCRIGDKAVVNGVDVGIITHLPEDSNDWIRILEDTKYFYKSITSGAHSTEGIPLPEGTSSCSANEIGKYNDKFTLAYKTKMNETAIEPYQFPAVEEMTNYAPDECADGTVCGKGEWYIPSCSELMQIYGNRYIIYNLTKSTSGSTFISTCVTSSSFQYSNRNNGVCFSGTNGVGGIISPDFRNTDRRIYPMLSFGLK